MPWTERLETALSPHRKEHTLGVMLTALSAAKRLGVDEESAFTAAALHDVAKAYPDAFADKIPTHVPSPVKHQYAGAELAKNDLGITDEDVLNAIRYHTSARGGMSTLEKLIYVADMIEPGRDYPCVNKLRKLFHKNFDRCFLACLSHTVKHLKKQKKEIYPLTVDALRYYKKRRKKDEF
ncbi:MAG: bis(5'-nucleosyl)-tetraphosphatase (symmetrical) YqeK [Clostridia bacterium]|nr:bis(5'-nucleosyl)-tetraphosphatase (symmetrical) YqeK [Clostridia bacterium]